METELKPEQSLLESLRKRCLSMYNNISFSPERLGQSHFDWRSSQLNSLLEQVPEEFKSYVIEKFKSHYSHQISSIARIASPMITGPSNFPSHRMEKYSRWQQSSSEKLDSFIESTIKRFNRKEKVGLNEAYERAKDELEGIESYHEMMVACNAFLRKNKDLSKEEKIEELENMGFSEKDIVSIFDTRWNQCEGFMRYELTNSKCRIKGKKETLAKLEVRVNDIGEEKKIVFENESLKIVKNVERDRLQIFFDGKPDKEIIECLKKNGFRWTPTEGCWQSYLSINRFKLIEVKNILIKKELWKSENSKTELEV